MQKELEKIDGAKQRLLGKVVNFSHKGKEPGQHEYNPEDDEESSKLR